MRATIYVGRISNTEDFIEKQAQTLSAQNTHAILPGKELFKSPFSLSAIPENTKLLIVLDCPYDFDFERFYPVRDNRANGGDLIFTVKVERRGQPSVVIDIPNLIFTTEKLNPKWKKHGVSFSDRFNVIEI